MKNSSRVKILLMVFGVGSGFGMTGIPHALAGIDTVLVGNVRNAAASALNASSWEYNYGYGSVAYEYQIGRGEVTIGQYAAFLNAVATVPSESFQTNLWNSNMQTNPNVAGISRSGMGTSADPYLYSVMGSGERPITYVSFYEAAAFTNWLSNGAVGNSTIMSGAYTISSGGVTEVSRSGNVATLTSAGHTLSLGDEVTIADASGFNGTHIVTAVTVSTFSFVQAGSDQGVTAASGTLTGVSATRNVSASWWLPSEDEWVKAAYYDPTLNDGTGGYTLHANRSNSMTTNMIGAADGANYFDEDFATTQNIRYSNSQDYLTEGGAYPETLSYYGTFDQAGNVLEWNEAFVLDSWRGIRGGSWDIGEIVMRAASRGYGDPTVESPFIGFRVASVPEPSIPLLMLIGGMIYFLKRRRAFIDLPAAVSISLTGG